MERLFQAACRGNLDELYDSVREDSAVLQKLQSWGRPDTPLHLASMFGHVYFVKEYMRLSSISAQQLCKLNQDGYSPLHLASANGHLEIVKYLLEFSQQNSSVRELCMKKDRDGQTAIHCAVATGRIDLIDFLLSESQEAAMEVTTHQETVLHLAVKYHQHEALKFLIEKLGLQASGLLNLGDREGNTVLHLATAKRQLQSVELLVKQPGLNVNAENSCGLRASDITFTCGFNSNDVYIEEAIRVAGGCRSQKGTINIEPGRHNNTSGLRSSQEGDTEKENKNEWLKEMRSGIIVMASLIATVTFQVALTPPGGTWQDWGPNSTNSTTALSGSQHKPGKAISYDLARARYIRLMLLNANAFYASIATILAILIPFNTGFIKWFLVSFSLYITLVIFAFEFWTIIWLTSDEKWLNTSTPTPLVVFWAGILGFVFAHVTCNSAAYYIQKFWRISKLSAIVIRVIRRMRRTQEILH